MMISPRGKTALRVTAKPPPLQPQQKQQASLFDCLQDDWANQNEETEEQEGETEIPKQNPDPVDVPEYEQIVIHPPASVIFDSGSRKIKVNNTYKINVYTTTGGPDGINLEVSVGNLNAFGTAQTLALPEQMYVPTATAGTRTIAKTLPNAPYGWSVYVSIISSESVNGNSGGFNIQLSGR